MNRLISQPSEPVAGITTVILDFDGTIADTQSIILRSFRGAISELGLEPKSDDTLAATIGLPLKAAFMSLYPIDDAMAECCADTYRRLFDQYKESPDAVRLFPHVGQTLAQLHAQGVVLTIATSRGRDSLQAFLERFGLAQYISYIVCAGETAHHKPHPEPVTKTLGALNALPEATLVVGDTDFDIGMGRQAGCRTCGVTYGNQTRRQLTDAGATWVVDDFAELLRLV